jgi:hypothetical protein
VLPPGGSVTQSKQANETLGAVPDSLLKAGKEQIELSEEAATTPMINYDAPVTRAAHSVYRRRMSA